MINLEVSPHWVENAIRGSLLYIGANPVAWVYRNGSSFCVKVYLPMEGVALPKIKTFDTENAAKELAESETTCWLCRCNKGIARIESTHGLPYSTHRGSIPEIYEEG